MEPLELKGSRGPGASEDSGTAEGAGDPPPLIILKLKALEHLKTRKPLEPKETMETSVAPLATQETVKAQRTR